MKTHRTCAFLFAAVMTAALHAQTVDQGPGGRDPGPLAPVINQQSPAAIPDQYLVILRPDAGGEEMRRAENAIREIGGQVLFRYTTAIRGFGIHLPAAALQALRSIPFVAYIAADQRIKAAVVQTAPPRGLDRVSERFLPLDNRYTYGPTETGSGVHAYVIDTGIRLSHSEFGGRASDSLDVIDGSLPATDCNGHGTHVAGTIGGTTFGIAKGVTLHNVRVLDCIGDGTEAGGVAGVDWVAANAIHPAVANMSLQGPPGVALPALNTAVTNAVATGVTFVVAAGNDDADACTVSPALVPTAITVGSVDPLNDTRAFDSNWGTCLDLFGPGVGIESAWFSSDSATNTISGTSMAAPHVAGVAARYLENHAAATPAMVLAAIHNAADTAANMPPWGGIVNPGVGSPNELLHWGSLNDGFDDGDPHITTVDGTRYDFQTAGEFVTLRDGAMEIQTRQTAIATTFFPGANPHTGLATCVSVNTAVAARVGFHRVTYQPNISGVPDPSGMQLRVDGALTTLGPNGLMLTGGGRIANAPAGNGIEVQFPDDTILQVTPGWWANQGKWYLNVHVARTPATMGIMGAVPAGSWLPALPDGTSIGPMPSSLSQRYTDLNQTFANAWRVTPATSLFDYAPGTSTATFTLPGWPPAQPPCTLPDTTPAKPATQQAAEEACALVEGAQKEDCIFDVRVTGEPGFATTYLVSQRLRKGATTTTLLDMRSRATLRGSFTAAVRPLHAGGATPSGFAQLFIDGTETGAPVRLDGSGRATWPSVFALPGTHRLSASYTPDPGTAFLASRSLDVDAAFVACEPGTGGPYGPTVIPPHDVYGRRWWWGGAVGSAHPLNRLNKVADANIYAKLDAARALNSALALRLALGFAQFTAQPFLEIDHPHYGHLSANVQWLAPFGTGSRLFLNAGPGWYRDQNSSTSLGGNVGGGVQLDTGSTHKIELGADYHFVREDRARFVTWHLGVLFRR